MCTNRSISEQLPQATRVRVIRIFTFIIQRNNIKTCLLLKAGLYPESLKKLSGKNRNKKIGCQKIPKNRKDGIMEKSELLGKTFNCTCGKKHTVPTQHFHYKEDAYKVLGQMIEAVTEGQTYLIFADARTFEAAGHRVEQYLSSAKAQTSVFIVPDFEGGSPHADDKTKDLIMDTTPPVDVYIAVGSGVINDLVKWVAYLKNKPYITVPTAASMNGYASANVAATVDGLKVLFHADACKAVVVEPDVIINAPYELTASGLGDVLAKSVSSADWKLNQFLFDDYYCQFSVDLLKDLEPVYLENPLNIKKKEPTAIKALFQALFYSSIAMTITGTSSPASGGEHLISHTIDMLANRDKRKHDFHGLQVGVASILMAAIYEKVLSIDTPQFREVASSINTTFWTTLSPIVEKEYAKKMVKFEKATQLLSQQENWQRLKDKISPGLVPAAKLKKCLVEAGAAHCYHDIRDNGMALEREKFVNVVKNANQMRERFTVLDLAVLVGIIPENIDQLIDDWVAK